MHSLYSTIGKEYLRTCISSSIIIYAFTYLGHESPGVCCRLLLPATKHCLFKFQCVWQHFIHLSYTGESKGHVSYYTTVSSYEISSKLYIITQEMHFLLLSSQDYHLYIHLYFMIFRNLT